MSRTVAALAAAVAIAGCGGGGDEKSGAATVSETVTGFTKAFSTGDGAAACDLLTTAARDAFVKRARTATGARDCATAMTSVHDLAGSSVTRPLGSATVSEVRVSGATATAKLTAAGHSTTVNLSRQGGDWKLNGVPGI